MGITSAPSHFQRVIATEVLAGLIGIICMLYIDDIIIFGDTEETFLENLEQVLMRLDKHGITVNPDKCSFGLEEIEYVGHTISANGIHFTRSKLDSVMNFQKPMTQKGMKGFIGLVNYFRDHVANSSVITAPLEEMVKPYNPKSKLEWTPERESKYEEVKLAVHECPSLWFVDENQKIFVKTDSSDYGIGGYMYQVIDESEKPIAFISKAYDKPMLKWSAYMKEGFAINYALKKWRHLLLDRPFVLQTDCRNLSFLDKESDSKVLRWLTTFQEYEFEVQHVAGKDNFVADSFSRLCILGRGGEKYLEENNSNLRRNRVTFPNDSDEHHIPSNPFIRALRSGLVREIPAKSNPKMKSGGDVLRNKVQSGIQNNLENQDVPRNRVQSDIQNNLENPDVSDNRSDILDSTQVIPESTVIESMGERTPSVVGLNTTETGAVSGDDGHSHRSPDRPRKIGISGMETTSEGSPTPGRGQNSNPDILTNPDNRIVFIFT